MKKQLAISNECSTMPASENTIGIDLGDKWSRYCVLDAAGEVMEEGPVRARHV